MEVQIISSENIKPSSPTPPHLLNMTLSFLDQKYAPLLVPTLLFYDASKGSAPLDIPRLKTCLSQTLSYFYPLAGRYKTWGTILCNDQGIPFVEAKVNCPLSHVLSSISNSAISLISFYPPKDDLIASGIHLAIQVNVFTCGGFAIGWYHTHKVTDGTSAATFLRHWAALVTKRYKDAAQAQPDFSASIKAFPPIPEEVKEHANAEEVKEAVVATFPPISEEVNELVTTFPPNPAFPPNPEEVKDHVTTSPPPISEEVREAVTTFPPMPEEVKEHVTGFPSNPAIPEEVKEDVTALFRPIPEEDMELAKLEPKTGDQEKQKEKKGEWSFLFEKRIVARSFVFKKQAITELKAKSMSDQLQNPSRFVSVAGFLWKQILLASAKGGSSMFSVAVDLRSRSNPPMPKASIGNLIEIALTRVEGGTKLPEMVAEIHKSTSKMKDIVSEYQGENRVEAKEKYWQNFMKAIFECKGKDVYALTSWCGSAGFGNVDFGFGKPKWIVPIDGILSIILRNTIILTECTDSEGDDGFEAWMFLEEESMKFLETNPEFLAFASPNFKLNNGSDSAECAI